MTKRYCLLILFNFLMMLRLSAQTLTSDELFQMARKEAFDKKNYADAILLSNQALLQSPGYTDIQIFLGRVYYWNNQPDSSLLILKSALQDKPAYEETYIAISDIEYYLEHYANALTYSEQGLKYNPSSKELILRKAKSLAALNRFKEAYTISDSLLKIDPKNGPVRALTSRIQDLSSKNKIGLSYDYIYFDKQFANPWHLVSLDYSRQTKGGSVIGRINYANRFAENGVQFEVDAYPRISKTFYAYTNIGYSPDVPVFPKYRAGFSLYANLPHSFEGEVGFRYLYFFNDTWIYTLSAGKYYKNFWFNLRTYLVPSKIASISYSYNLIIRGYLKGAENYLSLSTGYGISPDDRSITSLLNYPFKLKSYKIGLTYHFTAGNLNIFSLSSTYQNVEYLPKTKGNQIGLSASYSRRF